MKDAPFILNQRKTVCENSLFRIYFDHLIGDESSLVQDYLVVEPKVKNSDGVTGVAILPIKNNKFGLVKVYRHPVGEYGWEVPRGFIDKDEAPKDAAIRELREETGLTCDKSTLQSLNTITPEPGVISAKINLYMVDVTSTESFERKGELGHVGFNWFTYEETQELIENKLLSDAITIVTILKAF